MLRDLPRTDTAAFVVDLYLVCFGPYPETMAQTFGMLEDLGMNCDAICVTQIIRPLLYLISQILLPLFTRKSRIMSKISFHKM